MLGPSRLPNEYSAWNREHKAPFGSPRWVRLVQSRPYGMFAARVAHGRFVWQNRMSFPRWLMRRIGAFAFRINSLTRTFEHPWCFHATLLDQDMRAVEIGAGASGFQFVLAEHDLNVVSVDPLVNPSGTVDWVFSSEEFRRINGAFGGRVRFIQDHLENAHIESDGYDRVFAISVLEQIPGDNVLSIMREIQRILKPGGFFIATTDLFLDCHPFADRIANQWRQNVSVRRMVEESDLVLKSGLPCYLQGYPEFDAKEICRSKRNFLIVNDVMTQCLVLQKLGS